MAKRHTFLAITLLGLLTILFLNRDLFPDSGEALGTHDTRALFYPWLSTMREAVWEGRLPIWEPDHFNGYPFISNPQVAFFYPPTWLAVLLPVNTGISWIVALHIWFSGIGMLFYTRFMGARWLGSLLAAVTFAFSGYVAVRLWAGHLGVVATASWTPWILLATAWSMKGARSWMAALAGMALGLAFLAGHTPSLIYVLLIWIAFVAYLVILAAGQRWIAIRQVSLMALVGLGIAAVQIVPTLEFVLNSQRAALADFEFATDFSLPPAHLITFIVPEFFGEPTRTGYWSVQNFEELTYYTGLLSLVAVILGLRKPTKLTWFYFSLMVLGLVLALGRYGVLFRILLDVFPYLSITRAPARATFLFVFAASALLGHTISTWEAVPIALRKEQISGLMRWTLLVFSVAGIAALAANGAVFMAIHPTDTSGRLWHQLGGYSAAIVLMIASGGILWAYLSAEVDRGRRKRLLAASLIAVAVVDLWIFGIKFVRVETVDPDPVWLESREVIKDENTRILPWGVPIFAQNGNKEVGLQSVFGYESLAPGTHLALASSVPDPRSSAYDILNAGYVVAQVPLDQFTDGDAALELVKKQGSTWVYKRPKSLPNIRLLYEYEVIENNQSAIERLHDPNFDPNQNVILQNEPNCPVGPTPSTMSTPVVTDSIPGLWRIVTRTDSPGLLVLAETDYPGWQVTVDGASEESLRAYTSIKAVCVPVGEHFVDWRLVPYSLLFGGALTLLTLVIVLILLGRYFMQRCKIH
jgi:hypothetical protein